VTEPSAKQRLTEAAIALFDEHGYESTTVEHIAERAGVGRTTFFRAFRSKEDVIFPEHREVLRRIEERLTAATPETSLIAVSEAARIVLVHYLGEGDLARSRYRLTRSVPALRDREIASLQQYQQLFRRFIRAWMAPDPYADLRSELMAAAVVTAHNHVLRRWLRDSTDRPEEEFDVAMAEVVRLFAERHDAASGTTVVVLRSPRDVESLLPTLRKVLAQDEPEPEDSRGDEGSRLAGGS
jgi:AcrR family transcriptional regulator